MIIPDANLLIYAYDETSPHHAVARAWWERVLSGREVVGIPWIVVLAFCRLMTHPVSSRNPMSVQQVRKAVQQWLDLEHVRYLSPSTHTFEYFFALLEEAGTGGNLCTDAMIAALAIEQDGTLYSNDADFARFKGLSWKNPLAHRR